jgi:methylmalonyl-CoA mutase C-terminal domain/subunit
MTGDRIRVLMAKPGLDGHELGAIVVARGLSEAGLEVIYTGLHQTPEQIVYAAIQEDVNVIGVSIYSGAHVGVMQKLIGQLRERGVYQNFLVIVGGPIPLEDVPQLKALGVAEVFSSRTPIKEIVEFIQEKIRKGSKL